MSIVIKESIRVDIYFYQPNSSSRSNNFQLSSVEVIEGVRTRFSKVYPSYLNGNICLLLDSFLEDACLAFNKKREELLLNKLSLDE